ncbi:MAG: DegT/DnrJ/EryC1/StrS aminotransferase family protein [Candidatus Omnitrophica bacterium]|nr:DegT/DnrJ/EryC1/StrS aminotransferase family protein [Candidatus Omnitrophota bacterium]
MFWKLQEDVLNKRDLELLIEFIKSTSRFTQFTNVRKFEEKFSQWQKCKNCVYVNSGSSANFLLINALKELNKWLAGDEIIVPAVTWPTNIGPVIQNGLKPIFVDVNLKDLAFDYERLKKSITKRTRAIFVTHLIGIPADMPLIKKIVNRRPIAILEDCCESQGAKIGSQNVGSFGIGGTFSFYWGHHMTTVEGGMICTDSEELYKILLLKRSHGLARELPFKYHEEIRKKHKNIDFKFLFLTDGFNMRNTELHAEIGLSQLKRVDNYIKIRNSNYAYFMELCGKYGELILLKPEGISSFSLPFIFKDRIKKMQFQKFIAKYGIESRPLISGNLLLQPFLKTYYNPKNFNHADFLHNNAFYIGNNQFVDTERLRMLSKTMDEFFKKR